MKYKPIFSGFEQNKSGRTLLNANSLIKMTEIDIAGYYQIF